jgi:hypothetical protein
LQEIRAPEVSGGTLRQLGFCSEGETAGGEALSEKEEQQEENDIFMDGEFIHDSIGVSYFLPRKRCKSCDD